MLDQLLGRASLKERIAALEEELDACQQRLEAEQERRSEASRKRQNAEERANRLEDRIADLEGTVERLRDDGGDTVSYTTTETLHGGRLSSVLDRLESYETGAEGVLTAYVADEHRPPDAIREAFGEHAALVSRAAPCLAVGDDAGLLGACLSVPKPPAAFAEWDDHVTIERSWFEPTGTFALALVRSDLFAMGEYEGRERTAFHGFDSALKSQHSKGGYSQSRFERLRDEQIDTHVDRCRAAIEQREADRLYVVGERGVVNRLAGVADATATVDATGDPEPALDDAFREFWRVQLRGI
jgi:peptide subunit release factor 1 (eRF1)